MTTTSTATHRYIGVTDEATTCDLCGRTELARTVILALLDEDGNDAERVCYGTTCAARALTTHTGCRHTGAKVLAAAQQAELVRRAADRQARETLGWYGLPLRGAAHPLALSAAVERYAVIHCQARWAVGADWRALVLDMLARHQSAVIW